MFDWEEIERLLRIVELSRGHPNLKAIHDAANAELANLAAGTTVTSDEPVEGDGDDDE